MLFDATAWLLASMFFYPALLITFLILWGSVEQARGNWALFTTVVFGYLVFAKFPEIMAIVSNPFTLTAVIVGYIAAAALWGRLKWSLVLNKVRDKFIEGRDLWETRTGKKAAMFTGDDRDSVYSKMHESDYVFVVSRHMGYHCSVPENAPKLADFVQSITPQASKHKKDIIMWMAYWPLSVIWFICSDFLTTLAEEIYRRIAGSFQKMSDNKFNDLA